MKTTFGLLFVFAALALAVANGDKPLTVEDIMRFNHIKDPTISEDGAFIAYSVTRDRGDGEAVIRATTGAERYRIAQAHKPNFTKDGKWAGMDLLPSALELEKAAGNKKKKAKLKKGFALVDTANGDTWTWDLVKSYTFSDDSQWVAIHFFPEDEKPEKEEAENGGDEDWLQDEKPKKKKKEKDLGTKVLLRNLTTALEIDIEGVGDLAFDPLGRYLIYSVSLSEGKGNGVFYRNLAAMPENASMLVQEERSVTAAMAWDKTGERFAYLYAVKEMPAGEAEEKPKKEKPLAHQLRIWQPQRNRSFTVGGIAAEYFIPAASKLTWSKDSQRLFFGVKPGPPKAPQDKPGKAETDADLFDVSRLRSQSGLDVWHGQDPFIKPNERKRWQREKKQTLLCVFHAKREKTVQLADETVSNMRPGENTSVLLQSSDLDYRRESTWSGGAADYYAVSLDSGKRTLIARGLKGFRNRPTLSPDGRFAAYFKDGHVHLVDIRREKQTNLTTSLPVSFANEDHDYPSAVPGYGFGGWLEKDEGLLVYDKYDVWLFPTRRGEAMMLTGGDGRERKVVYRLVERDEDKLFYTKGEKVLLSAYYDLEKKRGFYQAEIGQSYVAKRMEDYKTYTFVARAKKADTLIFTREDFSEYPDLWVADLELNSPRRLTNENPQISEFAWGQPELVSWRSADGIPLQGILIKPGNYQPGKRYPVVVYYYRFFTQRLYRFNEMVINHRPNFPFYTSNGYAMFLPDIRFQVGTPGASAVECLVPGIQKIVDMGVADPEAIGLHGHSWSGYQTAFAVTQTDIFAAAVAGAPVSNMTSAYSGIRLGTGLARQFQYETGQSRIGASMWDRRDLYIENSPVFFADRINTPMLIQFGDIDEAVPWQQGIELYLAMRRLGKDVVFLQYHDEPHHLKKYPNKLDYTLKMKEYLDHYLKGEPAPNWLASGVPFEGD